jgi:hypothetical protein
MNVTPLDMAFAALSYENMIVKWKKGNQTSNSECRKYTMTKKTRSHFKKGQQIWLHWNWSFPRKFGKMHGKLKIIYILK